ncbi:MAG: type II toxin-antitoxin system VapC family toxin [Bacteroidetes bacterium]|nr:type II toxin-antitoxin system VapC family toxin [Bacteroidota bacterium]
MHSPLSAKHKKLFEDSSNRIFTSQISLMELAIKKNLNKLPNFVPSIETIATTWLNNGFDLMKLSDRHIFSYQDLPLLQEHRDPFDRFLIAIAKVENLTILTTDSKFSLYSSIVRLL